MLFLFQKKAYLFILFFLSFFQIASLAQYGITGVVLNETSKQPIAGATLFLSNTQIKSISQNNGSFHLLVPQGNYNLVVTYVGFESAVINLPKGSRDSVLHITLSPKTNDLGNVTVRAYDPDGWKKWGDLFIENFIGTSSFARRCKIENPDVIHFAYSEKKNVVYAFADEPIEIENNSLGYHIRYELKQFVYDKTNLLFQYEGYPLFTELQGNAKQQQLWKRNREDAFAGSEMQFMRALYRNKVEEEGYEIRKSSKITAAEKQRVLNTFYTGAVPKDSSRYYNLVSNEAEGFSLLGNEVLTGDSIAYGEDSVTVGVLFKGTISIKYLFVKAPYDYNKINPSSDERGMMVSQLSMQHDTIPVYVQSNGSLDPGLNLFITGYWAWSEKIARLLPFDYIPSN